MILAEFKTGALFAVVKPQYVRLQVIIAARNPTYPCADATYRHFQSICRVLEPVSPMTLRGGAFDRLGTQLSALKRRRWRTAIGHGRIKRGAGIRQTTVAVPAVLFNWTGQRSTIEHGRLRGARRSSGRSQYVLIGKILLGGPTIPIRFGGARYRRDAFLLPCLPFPSYVKLAS